MMLTENDKLETLIISETSDSLGTETLGEGGLIEPVVTRPLLVDQIPKRWQ